MPVPYQEAAEVLEVNFPLVIVMQRIQIVALRRGRGEIENISIYDVVVAKLL